MIRASVPLFWVQATPALDERQNVKSVSSKQIFRKI